MTKTLEQLLAESKATWDSMTSAQRANMLEAQRKSWARGEAGMGSDKDEVEYAKALREGDKKTLARLEAESQERMNAIRL